MGLRQEGFWDGHYELELRNYEEDGDEGEVWFGKGLSRRIADWIIAKLEDRIHEGSDIELLDVGCGNAYLACTFVGQLKKKYGDRLDETRLSYVGIDYSANSISLSKKIVQSKGLAGQIELAQCDFLQVDRVSEVCHSNKFDFIIDVGTFDAICLLATESDGRLEDSVRKYVKSLYSLVKDEVTFILASCNHTQDEIESLLQVECEHRCQRDLVARIETPRLQFGGKEGSQVTCLIFTLKAVGVQ